MNKKNRFHLFFSRLIGFTLFFASLCNLFGIASYAYAEEYADGAAITSRMDSLKSYFPNGKYWSAGKTETQLKTAAQSSSWSKSAFGVTDTGCKHNSKTACSCHGYKCTSNTFGGGTQCYGFARFIGYLLYPEYGNPQNLKGWTKVSGSSLSSYVLEPGDIICEGDEIHSAIVWKVSGSTVSVAEVYGRNGTQVGGKNHGQTEGCKIHWGSYWSAKSQESISAMSKILSDVKAQGGYILKHPDYIKNPFAIFSSTGTSSNGFYRIVKGAGNLFEYPYSDSTVKGTVRTNIDISSLATDDVVEVVETVKNSIGNSWAKLRNGYYISMDNLELLYTSERVNLSATSTQKDLQLLPFNDARIGTQMSGSSMQVQLVEKIYNNRNSIWYKISSDQGGYFINVNNLSNITNNVTLTLRSGSTWPGNKTSATGYPRGELEKGKGFGLRGIIDSNENITKVVGSITNLSTGANVSVAGSPQIVSPNAQTINIKDSNINNNLLFDKLDNGNYRFTVTATTASGYSKALIDEAFTVGSSTIPTLKVENIDIWYWGENVINGTTLEYDDSDIGYQCSISAAVSPDSASNNITWSNSNSNVVTLDAANYNFVVKGFGTTTITVSSTDGSNITESITVKVTCRHPSSIWKVTQEATYTSTGTETQICSICGQTISTRTIPMLMPVSGSCGVNLTWQYNNGTLTISGSGEMNDYQSPSSQPWVAYQDSIHTLSIDYGVSSIGNNAFRNCLVLTTATLPESIARIGQMAFYHCEQLNNITMPNFINSIEYGAFAYCYNLSNFIIPYGLSTIAEDSFNSCTSLLNIFVPESVTAIEGTAFAHCSQLKRVDLPKTLKTIGYGAFAASPSLKQLILLDNIISIGNDAFSQCTAITIKTIPGSYAANYAQNNSISIEYFPTYGICGDNLSWQIDNQTLYITGNGEMYNSYESPWFPYNTRIAKVSLEYGITKIGTGAFSNMANLKEINLPYSLTSIEISAFQGCQSLHNIDIPNTVKSIGALAFSDSGIQHISIPNSVETLGEAVFQDCHQLISVILPNSISKLCTYTFLRCYELTTVEIPDNITEIENWTFHDCPKLVISTSKGSFADTYAQENNIPVKYIAYVLTAPDLQLPTYLTVIEEEAFAGIPAKWIKLSAKVTTIGPRAFADCMNLTEIYIPETATSISATAFEGVPAGLTIYTKSGSYAEFYATNNGYNVYIVPSKTAAQ